MPQVAPGTFKPMAPAMPKEPTAEALAVTFDDNDPVFQRGDSNNGSVVTEDKTGNKTPVKVDDTKLPELPKTDGKATEAEQTFEEGEKVEEKAAEKEVEEKKAEPSAKDYIKAPTAKKVEGEVKEGEKKEVITKMTPPAKGTEHFDYTGYSEQEKDYLKNMSRPAREYASKIIKEHKELSKLKEFNYYQAPDAYQLSPEFKTLQEDAYYANAEIKHYSEQLSLIKQAKPFTVIRSWKKDGTPILSEPINPTDQSEEEVRLGITNLHGTVQQLKAKAGEFPVKYKQAVDEGTKAIEQERQNRFAWVADPTMLDHTVSIEGMGDVPIRQVQQQMTELFPPYMRAHPAVKVVGDMMVTFHIMNNMLKDAQKSSAVNAIKVEEVKRGEPSSNTKPGKPSGAEAKWGVSEFDMSGMPQ